MILELKLKSYVEIMVEGDQISTNGGKQNEQKIKHKSYFEKFNTENNECFNVDLKYNL